jgi:ABC-type nitrate/sulfonate/bicarbonate transport system permease component
MQGQHRLRMREVLAGLALLLVIAALIDIALRQIESRSLKWRPPAQTQ